MAGKRVKKRVQPRTQKQKFLEAARALDNEEAEANFKKALKQIAPAPAKRSN